MSSQGKQTLNILRRYDSYFSSSDISFLHLGEFVTNNISIKSFPDSERHPVIRKELKQIGGTFDGGVQLPLSRPRSAPKRPDQLFYTEHTLTKLIS